MNKMKFIRGKFKEQERRLTNYIKETNKEMYDDLFYTKNCAIAGGAITSVFTNSMINDYDIYFPMNTEEISNTIKQNKIKKLCKRCRFYDGSNPLDIINIISNVKPWTVDGMFKNCVGDGSGPSDVYKCTYWQYKEDNSLGCIMMDKINEIRNQKVDSNDYTAFTTELTKNYGHNITDIFTDSDFASTYTTDGGLRIQAIKLYGEKNIEEILSEFDFTVCMGAYLPYSGEFVLAEDFLLHNASKKLEFNYNTDYPIASLIRSLKYTKDKGYTISGLNVLKIAMAIQRLNLETVDDFRKHVAGIDATILYSFMNELKGNKTEYDTDNMINMISAYLDKNEWAENFVNN